MAARKKQPQKLNIREYRSKVAALKRQGLVSKHIDARSHKPTRYMLDQLKRFDEVLEGKALAVKAPSKSAAREFSDLKDTKFDRVIIRTQKGETASFDKSSGALITQRKSPFPGVQKMKEILYPRTPGKLPKLPRDNKEKVYKYGIPFKRGDRIKRLLFDSAAELKSYMRNYEKTGFESWKEYIEVIEITRSQELRRKRAEKANDGGQTSDKRRGNDGRRAAAAKPRDAQGRFIKSGDIPAKKAGASANRGKGKKRGGK